MPPHQMLPISFQHTPLAAVGQVKAPLPFAVSEIFWTDVVSANCISSGDDVKKVYDLVLDVKVNIFF